MIKQAPDHGSQCQRTGMLIIGIRIDRALRGTNAQHKLSSNELIQLTRLLVHCLGVDPWPAELFLDFSEASQQEAESAEGRPAEKKTRVEKGSAYKDDHFEIFIASDLTWPPTIDKSHETMRYRKSKRREQEMMYYLDKVFGKDQVVQSSGRSKVIQFCDLNLSLPRLLGIQEVSDYSPDNINSPWRTVVPTLTSKSKIAMRIIQGGRVSMTRPLKGHERMAMIGWPDDDVHRLKEKFADQALLTSFAGQLVQ